nr:TetR/AcrR family transcriptional regulator [Phytoactinopolyspora mesophila]
MDAAAHIMRHDGIARATTKEIARRAGFSEATLYKHFAHKTEIFVAVLHERAPGFADALGALGERVGQGTVAANLRDVTRAAMAFYDQAFIIAVGVFSERRVLEALRADLYRMGAGPEGVNHTVAAYLRAEQGVGRVRADVDADAAASLLMGACLQRAFFRHFYDREAEEPEAKATEFVRVVIGGIETAQ